MKNSKGKRPKSQRILLPAGCSISAPTVSPSNWKQAGAGVKDDWYFFYRFYDPLHMPKGKQKLVKGMNIFRTAAERRQATERLLQDEIASLKQGYNPVTGNWTPLEQSGELDLTEDSPFTLALQIASKNLSCARSTKNDIRSMLHWVPVAIAALKFNVLPIGQVKEKHILRVLDKCSQIKSRWDDNLKKQISAGWSPHKYNKYRSYMMILFKKIKRAGAIEVNPCKDIEKEQRKEVKAKRQTLTRQQRIRVDKHLTEAHPAFRRFLHIFFHSGARETEIIEVRGKHVDLERQIFTRILKKGGDYREVPTTIKDVALPLWREAMKNCRPDDFVFGRGFVAGPMPISSQRINRVWKKLIKDKLEVTADFYSLKHSNTTETASIAGDQVAADQNAHTTTAMVVNIYDVERESREHAAMRKVNNPFV